MDLLEALHSLFFYTEPGVAQAWWQVPLAIGGGLLSGWLDNRSKNNNPQTTTQVPDAGSQQYIDQMRSYAGNAATSALGHPGQFFLGPDHRTIAQQAQPFFNPFQQNVIGGLNQSYDRLRSQAQNNVNQAATSGGAFGGSRHAISSAVRLGEIDRAHMGQVGNLLHTGWQNAVTQGLQYSEYSRALRERQAQEPLFRHQQAMSFLNQGMGPVGWQTTTRGGGGSPLATGIGTGLSIYGAMGQSGMGGRGGIPQRPGPLPTPGFQYPQPIWGP